MGLTGKSLFRRRNRKSKKKLAESQAILEGLTIQLDETEKYETQLHSQISEKKTRLQIILQSKTSLLERIRAAKEKLEKVEHVNKETTAKLEEQRQRQKVELDTCRKIEIFHQELPLNVWNLQAQICKAFRLIENTKRDISTASLKQDSCKYKLVMKREEIIRNHIEIKATKEKILKAKSEIKKISETKKIREFHKKCMETLVVYVMQMNLRAANSRTKMIERRGEHLKKMLDGITSETQMYTCLTNQTKKKQYQTRPLKVNKNVSSFDVGVV